MSTLSNSTERIAYDNLDPLLKLPAGQSCHAKSEVIAKWNKAWRSETWQIALSQVKSAQSYFISFQAFLFYFLRNTDAVRFTKSSHMFAHEIQCRYKEHVDDFVQWKEGFWFIYCHSARK